MFDIIHSDLCVCVLYSPHALYIMLCIDVHRYCFDRAFLYFSLFLLQVSLKQQKIRGCSYLAATK